MAAVVQPGAPLLTRPGEEVWEITVPGRVWVDVTNERGKSIPLSVGGRVGARLRISTEDRIIAQERIVDVEFDPFVNGMLVRIDADQQGDEKTASGDALGVEELLKVFAYHPRKFQTTVDRLGQVAVRRLLEAAESVDATSSQISYLKKTVEAKWPIGGDTPTYRELKGLGQAI